MDGHPDVHAKTIRESCLRHHQLIVNRYFAGDAAFLRESLSAAALNALGQLVSEQYRRGAAPLGPREWGMFLEFVLWREKTPAASYAK